MNKKDIKPNNNFTEIIEDTLLYAQELDLDDLQLYKIDKFNKLEIYEKNLLIMRSSGMSLRQIGKELDISYQWVRIHLNKIYDKLL